MTNQSKLQESIRTITGTTNDYNGDWHALFDFYSITAGEFNGRMIEWLQSALNSTETDLDCLKQLYADSLGAYNWNSVNTVGHALPNQQLRLDASQTDTITDSNGNVTAWADKSGNGNHSSLTAGTPSTGDSTENGLNIIDFSGVDQMSLPSALYTIPNGNNTMFVVSKRVEEDGTVDATLGASTGAQNEFFHVYSFVSGTQSFTNRSGSGGSVSSTGNTNTSLNIAQMLRAGTTQSISVNGETPVTNLGASSSATIDDFFIGSGGSSTLGLNGSIGEIIIYDTNLTSNVIMTVNMYLADKWGVTLA